MATPEPEGAGVRQNMHAAHSHWQPTRASASGSANASPVARESAGTTTSRRNALPHKPARAHLLRQKIEGMAYQGGDGHVVPEFMEMSLSSITKVLARSLGVEPHDLKAEKHLIKQIASDVLSEKFTASQLHRAQNSLEARFVQQGEQAQVDPLVSHSFPDADPTSFLGSAPGFRPESAERIEAVERKAASEVQCISSGVDSQVTPASAPAHNRPSRCARPRQHTQPSTGTAAQSGHRVSSTTACLRQGAASANAVRVN